MLGTDRTGIVVRTELAVVTLPVVSPIAGRQTDGSAGGGSAGARDVVGVELGVPLHAVCLPAGPVEGARPPLEGRGQEIGQRGEALRLLATARLAEEDHEILYPHQAVPVQVGSDGGGVPAGLPPGAAELRLGEDLPVADG